MLEARHGAELFPALCDPRVYEWIDSDPPQDVEALEKLYAEIARGPRPEIANQTWRDVCVKRQDTGLAIGRLESTTIDRRAEVGYFFSPHQWSHGYASEALRWYQRWLIRELGVTEFWACINPGNERSIRLVRRLGYTATTKNWPDLRSYDPGDLVFRRPVNATREAPH